MAWDPHRRAIRDLPSRRAIDPHLGRNIGRPDGLPQVIECPVREPVDRTIGGRERWILEERCDPFVDPCGRRAAWCCMRWCTISCVSVGRGDVPRRGSPSRCAGSTRRGPGDRNPWRSFENATKDACEEKGRTVTVLSGGDWKCPGKRCECIARCIGDRPGSNRIPWSGSATTKASPSIFTRVVLPYLSRTNRALSAKSADRS